MFSVSDFMKSSNSITKALKNEKKYMDFYAQFITFIEKTHDLGASR